MISPQAAVCLHFYKYIFSKSAKRAHPVVGNIFKGCAGGDSTVRVADVRVIDVAAGFTHILVHDIWPPYRSTWSAAGQAAWIWCCCGRAVKARINFLSLLWARENKKMQKKENFAVQIRIFVIDYVTWSADADIC